MAPVGALAGVDRIADAAARAGIVQKVLVRGGQGTIDLVVDEEPERAGIDPYNKLIDRVPSDNVAEASAR